MKNPWTCRLDRFAVAALAGRPITQMIKQRDSVCAVPVQASPAKVILAALQAYAREEITMDQAMPYPIMPQKDGAVIPKLPERITKGLLDTFFLSAQILAFNEKRHEEFRLLKGLSLSEF